MTYTTLCCFGRRMQVSYRIIFLAERFSRDLKSWPRKLLIHTAGAMAFAYLHISVIALLNSFIRYQHLNLGQSLDEPYSLSQPLLSVTFGNRPKERRQNDFVAFQVLGQSSSININYRCEVPSTIPQWGHAKCR